MICACGALYGNGEACDECAWLDGKNAPERAVIEALRHLGGRGTIAALIHETGLCDRQVRRGIASLVKRGRVRSAVDDDQVDENGGSLPALHVLVDNRRAA